MKTWEMIKELTENPKKTFRCTNGCYPVGDTRYVIGRRNDNYVCFLDDKGFRDSYFDIHNKFDWEWEIVPKEADWQDAIQAWINGKTVCCKKGVKEVLFFGSWSDFVTDKSYFIEGKWYITD